MEPAHPLRAHRQSRGWSQEDLAQRLVFLGDEVGEHGLGATGATVGRWERGERRPRPPYPKLLCLLFEATATELGIAASPYVPSCGRLDDVERRTLLRLLAAALAAPVLPMGKPRPTGIGQGNAETDRLVHALRKPSGADEAVVAAVEAAILSARRLDDVSGPRVAVRSALAQREIVRTLLEGGPSGTDVAKRLTVAAAEVSQLLGWLAFDMNDQRTSRGYLDEALRLAHEADADDLGAYALGYRSVVEVAEARPHEGLAFAEAARDRAEAKGSPATRSWLAMAEADALAELGDRTGAERALDRARTAFSRSRAVDEPPWMYYYDRASLKYRIGSVYLTLERAEPARQAMHEALATSDASMVRDRAWYLGLLGQTFVLDEVDEACRLAGEALTIATATRCDRAVLRVRELRAHLGPWESEATVRDLDDQLAATSAWCRPVVA